MTRPHDTRQNEESDDRDNGDRHEGNDEHQRLDQRLFFRRIHGGGSWDGRCGTASGYGAPSGYGVPSGFRTLSKSTLRGLLGGIRLDLSTRPLARAACVGRRKAFIELINFTQLILRGGHFTHVASARSSRSFCLASRRLPWAAPMELPAISAISPTLNWPSTCSR